tara:strand:- start:83 stop:1369 length:1287 start_codon:yes stop_codon:yes gene_type:complete
MTSFCLYGLGVTGKSVINYFDRKNLAVTYSAWDDDISKRDLFGYHDVEEEGKRSFSQDIDTADFIVVSPGINLKKSKLKRKLIENKHKIITDLDLFYLFNPKIKTIVITGTNGKSTTCKILEHVLRKNNINVRLGGNIGKPILDLNLKNNPIVIIEASSFQLAYSKFVRPNYAAILNITNDHLDWHGTNKNYINSKFKIFSNQTKKDIAFIDDIKFLKKYKRARYRAKLKFIKVAKYKKIKKFIKNNYLNLEVNQQNMSFVQAISKTLKIANKPLIKSLRSFKGLPHRHEIIYKKNNKTFINDSKATSFEASKFALKGNKNIFWILGGLPKKGDKFKLGALKKNIIKAYIVGKSMSIFRRELSGNVNFQLCKTIKKAIDSIFNDTKNIKNEKIVILLSPCSASYDQFNNFEERGSYFKKLIIKKFKGN